MSKGLFRTASRSSSGDSRASVLDRVPAIAIVTGGGSGIGAALGQALVRRGALVVLADIDADAVHRQAEELTKQGPGTADGVVVDVRDADAVARLVDDTHRAHGRLDLLVNNAGISIMGEPDELRLEHWDRILDVNLRGVIHGCHAGYPLMKRQGRGHIVNVASLAALVPPGGQGVPYATTKYAVLALSLGLRAAGADLGVRVSAVCPSFTDTAILSKIGAPDLPVPPSMAAQPDVRETLARHRVRLYPPERLADDVLRGVDRNKAIIIAPSSARIYALSARFAPALALRQAVTFTRQYRVHSAGPSRAAGGATADGRRG